MKKVIAIVLALTMIFSLASAASAYTVAEGQVYFGPVDNITADPGDMAVVTYEFQGYARENDGYPTNGSLHIPFMLYTGNYELNQIMSIALTDEAKAMGVTFAEGIEDMFIGAEECGLETLEGEVIIPSQYIYGNTHFTLFTVETKISEAWEIVDYVATETLYIGCYAGADEWIPAYVDTEDGAYVEVMNFFYDDANITATPYEPTFGEKLVEKLKTLASTLLNAIIIGLNYVINNYLQPAWWNAPVVAE